MAGRRPPERPAVTRAPCRGAPGRGLAGGKLGSFLNTSCPRNSCGFLDPREHVGVSHSSLGHPISQNFLLRFRFVPSSPLSPTTSGNCKARQLPVIVSSHHPRGKGFCVGSALNQVKCRQLCLGSSRKPESVTLDASPGALFERAPSG